MEMDKLNWAILTVLQENSRLSFAEIGRQVGLSAPAVAERVQKLEDNGVIKGYGITLDLSKLGYTLQALVAFKAHAGKLPRFLELLQTMPEIRECYRVTGSECLMMKVAVKQAQDLELIINVFVEYGEPTTSVILSNPVSSKPVVEQLVTH
ncbi:Lrp/AsnC family transcriptional regulator [Pontibacter cellulosilyticus]|uniref:Lrp/AsnC family transcriptional regulator n=1 Tax=Pontibacter cellulosilyticus TaxID=1720253 RepID=A0A923N369_9BACT|nr:Lrp/AsnC family transcriptional regulator [Pontibacter cellulosilyticus]MBC5992055.1 Lrp/AsnC family transcriptional regulator [Pontibacter cellulosilyticus]